MNYLKRGPCEGHVTIFYIWNLLPTFRAERIEDHLIVTSHCKRGHVQSLNTTLKGAWSQVLIFPV